MDTLLAMRVFRRVVDLGGFSAAARDLGLSTAAVSKQVAALEGRLGARLLNRTTRRLSPTEIGAAYHARAATILDAVDEAEQAVSRLAEAPRGLLRVSAPMSYGVRRLSGLLPALVTQCPELRLDLVLNDRRIDLVEEGFDAAVRIGDMADTSLVSRRLAGMRRVWVASPGHLAREGVPQHPAELAARPCLVYTQPGADEGWPFREGGDLRRVRVSGPLQSNNGDVLAEAAAAGAGIAMLPLFIAEDLLAARRLVTVLDAWEPPPVGIHAVFPHARLLSPKVRVLVDFLAERLPPIEAERTEACRAAAAH